MKLCELAPLITATAVDMGTAGLSLESKTTALPTAGPVRVTFPVTGSPPFTLLGVSVRLERVGCAGASSVKGAVTWPPPKEAVMEPVWSVETTWVPTWKLTLVAPAGTSTFPCGEVVEKVVDNATSAPPAGAGPLRVTVPVVGLPPITGLGLKVRLIGLGASTVRVVWIRLGPYNAVRLTFVSCATGFDPTVKFAEVSIARGIATDDGTDTAEGLSLVRVTVVGPKGGFGRSNVTLPMAVEPPIRVLDVRFRAVSNGRFPVPVNTIVGTFVTWLTAPLGS